MRKPLARLFMPQTDGAGVLPIFLTPQAVRAEPSGPVASLSAGAASASHQAIDGPPRGRLMQIQDNDRADAPGSKPRHPLPRANTERRRAEPEDALDAPAPPTDDTPTIIS